MVSARLPRGGSIVVTAAASLAIVAGSASLSAAATPAFLTASNPPVLAGDVFDYALTQTTTTTVPGQKPIVKEQNDTEKIVATADASYGGRKNLIRLQYIDAKAPATTIYAYVGFAAVPGATAEVLYFSTSEEKDGSNGTYIEQTFPLGEIEDEFPEAAGLHWSDATPSTTIGNVVSALEQEEWTIARYADGSYSYDDAFTSNLLGITQGFVTKRVVAANGTGYSKNTSTGENPSSVFVGLPVALKGSHAVPVTFVLHNSSKAPPFAPQTIDVPDWYPSHDASPKPLASFPFVNAGLATTPAACGVRKGIKAFDIHGTSYVLDPVQGFYDTSTEDVYDAAGLGEVCAITTSYSVAYNMLPPGVPGAVAGTVASTSAFVLTNETGPRPLFGFARSVHPLSAGLRLRSWGELH